MSQVLIVIVIAYGSLLNLLAKPWSSTDSMLERRRNDIVAILLWTILFGIALQTAYSGVANAGTSNGFDLQDWTALILPFALAAPYLLELVAILVRQLETWRWTRRASIQALPLAWLYRTMTVGEPDDDGAWLHRRLWAPWKAIRRDASILHADSSFWACTSRQATLFHLFRRWFDVLLSALRFTMHQTARNFSRGYLLSLSHRLATLVFVCILTFITAALYLMSSIEFSVLLVFDYLWWLQCKEKRVIVARYDTVHFGRQEMQSLFEHSIEIKASLRVQDDLDLNVVHNRIMGAVLTTTAVLENSFRRAYLAVPVYEFSISNRKALREKYDYVGCDLDRLIKQVRVLLEIRHTSGLLSITSATGTIEASLHNNIESILSVALFFSSGALYKMSSRIATIEATIEQRLAADRPSASAEIITRERVVYIDARNTMFWILWILVIREWQDPAVVWGTSLTDRLSREEDERTDAEFPTSRTDVLYVIATFLSRCRYCDRYGLGQEENRYIEVRHLGQVYGKDTILREFDELSNALHTHRALTLLEWTAREYKISWTQRDVWQSPLECAWVNEAGIHVSAKCELVLPAEGSNLDHVVVLDV